MAITTYLTLKQAIENWLGKNDLINRVPEFIALAEDRIAASLRVQAMETSQVLRWEAVVDGGTVAGTANAITLSGQTGTPSLGDTFKFTAGATNTSTVTINTSYAVKRRHGGVKEGLSAGDIVNGAEYRIYFDGTDFLLIPPGGVLLPSNFLEQRRLYLDVSSGKSLDFFDATVFWGREAVNESGQPDIYTIEGDCLVAAPVPDAVYFGRLLYYRRFTALSGATDTNWALTNARGLYLYGAMLEAMVYLEDDAGSSKFAALFDQALKDAHDMDRRSRYPRGALSTRSQVRVV